MSDIEDDEPVAGAEEELEDVPAEGYSWSFARQERDLSPGEYRDHIHILDDMDEEDLEELDLSKADDYILWAAAQAWDELERDSDAIALLKRIAGSTVPHPALNYPDILLRLADRLKDRGDYDEAWAALHGAASMDPALQGDCDERRAEILVLRGRTAEGLALFGGTADAHPEDAWIPLRAGWALLAAGRYEEIQPWIVRAERALPRIGDEELAREVASEIDRLRSEAEGRLARAARLLKKGAVPDPGETKDEILAALDDEEARLTATPPRTDDALARAAERLGALHRRASSGWDDAVEAKDERLIAEFAELQWDVEGLAGRFGIELPDAADD